MELCRIDFGGFAVRELVYACGRRMAPHAHDYSNLTVVVSGDLEETTDTGEHRGRSCSVLLKPAGTIHSNYVHGRRGTHTVSIELHADELQALPWQWLEDPDSARAALSFYAAYRTGARDAIEQSAIALIATTTSTAQRAAGNVPSWLSDVKQILDARFDEPIRFEAVAAEVGLHPVYLSRAFRRHMGVAMGDYVRGLRLKHARHLLSETERPLAAISADAGFSDASHLCRVFAGTHAVTPNGFRQQVQSVP
jgi:AraC family transcriptional regulator